MPSTSDQKKMDELLKNYDKSGRWHGEDLKVITSISYDDVTDKQVMDLAASIRDGIAKDTAALNHLHQQRPQLVRPIAITNVMGNLPAKSHNDQRSTSGTSTPVGKSKSPDSKPRSASDSEDKRPSPSRTINAPSRQRKDEISLSSDHHQLEESESTETPPSRQRSPLIDPYKNSSGNNGHPPTGTTGPILSNSFLVVNGCINIGSNHCACQTRKGETDSHFMPTADELIRLMRARNEGGGMGTQRGSDVYGAQDAAPTEQRIGSCVAENNVASNGSNSNEPMDVDLSRPSSRNT